MSKGSEIERLIAKHGLEATRVKLYVLSQDQTRTPCETWPGPVQGNTPLALELLEQIEERALRQANVLGGSHAFCLELVGQEDKTIATEFFRVSAESMPHGAIGSEPANEGGAFAQMMRHNEAYFRIAMSGAARAEATLTRQNEMLAVQNFQLNSKLYEQLETVRLALMGEREHELAMVKAKGTARMKEALTDQMVNLLPEVASSVTKKVTGSAALAASVGMKGFLATIRPDQMAKIFEALDPEQQISLLGAMKHLAAEDEKKKAAAAPPPTTNGASNGGTPPTH